MSGIELSGHAAARLFAVDAIEWAEQARQRRDRGERLLSLWGSDERDRGAGFALWAAYLGQQELDLLCLRLGGDAPRYPDLAPLFPCAARMQRALSDLLGVAAMGADRRPWLRHAAWPEDAFPLRHDFVATDAPAATHDYRFVQVEGDGVHEIAVGPVHAGTIEPGQFRFSVVGEKVLRLEARLGYAHKGIERRFQALPALQGQRLAARICGDSAVAFAWAYCMALEAAAEVEPPARALHLRALLLERERIANHLGDLGALGNDAGFAFGLSQFSRLKEDLLRLNAELFAQRYPLDALLPGGVAVELDAVGCRRLIEQGDSLTLRVQTLRDIYTDHGGVQDRFAGCGRVRPGLARELGLLGLAARASGQPFDLRCDRPHPPYAELPPARAESLEGDVAARVAVRFDEILAALDLCRRLLASLPQGPITMALPQLQPDRLGVGLVEGWRGPVLLVLETGAAGSLRRCHAHDPSWQNWLALEHAIIGNIVPDFPLINKSFNLSYSGVDG